MENEFVVDFQGKIKSAKLDKDIQALCKLEATADDVQYVLAMFSMLASPLASVPLAAGINESIDKTAKFENKKDQRKIKKLRKKLSDRFMDVVKATEPKQFEDLEQRERYCRFLMMIDRAMLTQETKEQFSNFKEQMHLSWQSGVSQQQLGKLKEILDGNDQQSKKLEAFQRESREFNISHADAQKAIVEELKKQTSMGEIDAEKLTAAQGDINKIKEQFIALGGDVSQIDDKLWLLLVGQEKGLDVVLSYIFEQKEEKRKEILAQQKQANYETVINGFALIGAVGEVFDLPILQKISVVASHSVNIWMVASQIGQATGLAAINPFLSIGMLALNLGSMFFIDRGPTENEILMRLTQQVLEELRGFRAEMRSEFRDMHWHLRVLEQTLAQNFHAIFQLLQKTIPQQLNAIHQDLTVLMSMVNFGFQDVLLQSLTLCVAEVERLDEGIIPANAIDRTTVYHNLVTLANWLSDQAFNRFFTGTFLIERNQQEVVWRVTSRQAANFFAEATHRGDLNNVLPLMMLLAKERGWWSTEEAVRVPNSGIWYQAAMAYQKLRRFAVKAKIPYDAEQLELDQLTTSAENSVQQMQAFCAEEALLPLAGEELIKCLSRLRRWYDEKEALHSASESDHSKVSQLPNNIEIVPAEGGKHKGKKKDLVYDIFEPGVLTEQTYLALIAAEAKETGAITLFSDELLEADRLGLIKLRGVMYGTMASGGDFGDPKKRKNLVVWHTQIQGDRDVEKYGLALTLCFFNQQTPIQLTTPAVWGKWNDHENVCVAHKREVAKNTRVKEGDVNKANAAVKKVLENYKTKSKLRFSLSLMAELNEENSILHESLLYAYLLNAFNLMSDHHSPDLAKALDTVINMLEELKHTCEVSAAPSSEADIKEIIDELGDSNRQLDNIFVQQRVYVHPGPIPQGLVLRASSKDDGVTLFYALGSLLKQDPVTLRGHVRGYLEGNVQSFERLGAKTKEELNACIRALHNRSEQYGDIEIKAIQAVTNRPIIIIRPNAAPIIPDNVNDYTRMDPVFIYCGGDPARYRVLEVAEGFNAKKILEDIQNGGPHALGLSVRTDQSCSAEMMQALAELAMLRAAVTSSADEDDTLSLVSSQGFFRAGRIVASGVKQLSVIVGFSFLLTAFTNDSDHYDELLIRAGLVALLMAFAAYFAENKMSENEQAADAHQSSRLALTM